MAEAAVLKQPGWLAARRERAARLSGELPLPQFKGTPGWEFTDLSGLDLDAFEPSGPAAAGTALLDAPAESNAGEATVCTLDEAAERHPELLEAHLGTVVPSEDPFVARNDAAWAGGLFVHVPRGARVEGPLVRSAATGAEGTALNHRTLIVLEEGAEAEVWEQYLSSVDAAAEADLLLDLGHNRSPTEVKRFSSTAFVDIDPGLLQLWMESGETSGAEYDRYFTIGETVGTARARFPDGGFAWIYTPPPVFLEEWPVAPGAPGAPYTTVTHLYAGTVEIDGQEYDNDKRTAFLEYLDLPSRARQRLELALCLGTDDSQDRPIFERAGWGVRDAWDVTATTQDYAAYIRSSRGEFSCAKPSCLLLQNAWISDRTICYLASGKPAVVEYTGPSRYLPDAEGLFRFRSVEQAAAMLAAAESDYERHSRAARALAEEHFDASKVMARVLEQTLP